MLKAILRAGCFTAATFLAQPGPALADPDAGAYLAARLAAMSNDFATASRYYTKSLLSDPGNPVLLESAVNAYVALGQVPRAVPVARTMLRTGIESQLANLVLDADAVAAGEWDRIFDTLVEGHSVSPLVDGLVQAWAAVGLGRMEVALDDFDAVIATEGMAAYGRYQKALALALVGDFEAANALFAAPDANSAPFSARAALAHAQVLSQLERNGDALAMLDAVFGPAQSSVLDDMRTRLSAGERLSFDIVTTPRDGVAEVALMVAGLLQGEARDLYTLQYARIAQYLAPGDSDILMLNAALLQGLGRPELASDTYAQVAADDPAYPAAELGRIDALRQAGREDAAIEVAEALARSHPDLPLVHAKLGDVMRATERLNSAHDAYTRALDLYGDKHPDRWLVLYTRAITAHMQDNWSAAEADFRAALGFRPDHPQLLNYLGYSLVERGEKLDEALQMIETAVAAQPDNGAIVDSLGWVLFELGRFEEAVEPMERAAALEAVDPTINDHLGDVYWAVGRRIEAAFQWQRALSFDPDEALASRIRRKLEIGLDAVLAEEGAAPVRMANDEG